ncbi:MAG TPA: hypothetical protein PKW90_25935, partial [Myxococcota bacterium]|nr:hypothetical protein [Myxococcota bacterium]
LYLRVSERLSHRQRAILPRDYERLALSLFPSLYKVRCLPGSRAGKVELVVVPDIRRALPGEALQPKAAADQLADIQTALQALAPPSAHLQVRNARYVPVRVRLGVRFVAGQDESYGRTRLSEALLRFLSPWAYDEGEELVIGGKIYSASIVDFVDRQPYVDYVAEITLFRGMENGDWKMVPRQTGYHIAAEGPDEVLVSAREHDFTVIPDSGYSQSSFVGIGYMKVQLDFIVGA